MSEVPLRRVEVDWTFHDLLIDSDLVILGEDKRPRRGSKLPDGTINRMPSQLDEVASHRPKRLSPEPRFMVVATAEPSVNRDGSVAEGRTRLVVGLRRSVHGEPIWIAGLAPERDQLGHIEFNGLPLTAAAIPVAMGRVARAFLGEFRDGGYRRLITVNVGQDGRPGPATHFPMTEAQVAAIPGDIPIIEPPLFAPEF